MLVSRRSPFVVRTSVLAICLALVAGCNAEVVPAEEGVTPNAPVAALQAPTNLNAEAGGEVANLTWSAIGDATAYEVRRSTTSGGPYQLIATVGAPYYSDTAVAGASTYYYVVVAISASSVSASSAQVAVTLLAAQPPVAVTPPSAPQNLVASAGNAQTMLTWAASNGATGYRVKRGTTSGGPYSQVGTVNATSFADSSLTNGTTYYYVVSATNSAGESPSSTQVSAQPTAPVAIGQCNGLGGVDELQNVTPPGVRSVLTVAVDSAGAVYIGTESSGIHKSTDCGASWSKVNTGRNASVLDTGYNWTLMVNPTNPQVMYANALYGSGGLGLYRSTNGGKDWDSLFPPGSNVANAVEFTFFQQASFDPADPRHILATFHANCFGQYAPSCMAETTDGGDTWRLFKSPTQSWSEAARPHILSRNTWLLTTLFDGIFYTEDAGATWQKVGNGAGVQMYRSSEGVYFLSGLSGIQTSRDGGRTWTFLAGGQQSGALIGDGKRLFVGTPGIIGGQNYYAGPESGNGPWKNIPSPQPTLGAENFAYDSNHHLLYAATGIGGRVYRMRTE